MVTVAWDSAGWNTSSKAARQRTLDRVERFVDLWINAMTKLDIDVLIGDPRF